MNYNTQQSIIPGQVTQFRDVMYRAEKKAPNLPCYAQCECQLPEWVGVPRRCSGFCYRWANGDDIVFKRVNEPLSPNSDIVETKFAATCRKHGKLGAKQKGGEQQAMEVLVLQRKLNDAKKELRERDIEDYFNRKK